MCGIVGLALKNKKGFYKKQEDIFYDLLYVDALRGDDATGVIFVEKDGSFGIQKEASPSYYCLDAIKNSNVNKSMMQFGQAIIGHNRKATVGKIEDATAHPFVVDSKFAMVHNGTLYNHKKMHDTTVDSEALAIHLSTVLTTGYTKDKLEEELGKVDGAFAVVAYDQPSNKIYITRNSQRPMAFIETDDAIFWASEYGMLSWILSRHGVDVSKAKCSIAKEDTLYTIDLDKGEMTEEAYTPKKPIPVTTTALTVVTGGKKKVTRTSEFNTHISKNMFKSIKKKLLWETMNFWADDYLERNFPPVTIEDGETQVNLLGSLLKETPLGEDHTVIAELDLTQHPTISAGNILKLMYTGRIYEMTYNAKTKQVTVHMDRVRIVPRSSEHKDTIIDDSWIARKLEEHDKHETTIALH